jgi:hypothetical protein
MRQQTWFACLVCVFGVLPGFAVGALLKILMYVFDGWAEGSDFLYLRALFGLETPRMIYELIFSNAIPNLFQGGMAGLVAVLITEKICKGANHYIAVCITGALYTGILIPILFLTWLKLGLTSEMLIAICQLVGLCIGLGSSVTALPAPRSAAA